MAKAWSAYLLMVISDMTLDGFGESAEKSVKTFCV